MKRKVNRLISLLLSTVLCMTLFGSLIVSNAADNPGAIATNIILVTDAEGNDLSGVYPSEKNFEFHLNLLDDSGQKVTLSAGDKCVISRLGFDDSQEEYPQYDIIGTYDATAPISWTPAQDDVYMLVFDVEKNGKTFSGDAILVIGERKLKNCIYCDYVPVALYNGKPITPQIKIYYLPTDEELKPGTDYTVEYSNNVNEGIAVITVHGMGEYSGEDSEVFYIISPAQYYDDISLKDWYYKAVDFVSYYGLFNGISDTEYAPEDTMSRAMFVTVLGRLNGVQVNNYVSTGFTDVKKNQYYTGYVKWAADKGIVNGVSPDKFSPNNPVTREQICKMMVQYSQVSNITLKKNAISDKFADDASIAGWAKEYVYTCRQAGIINGKTGNCFDPKGSATRAEVAQIMQNYCENYMDLEEMARKVYCINETYEY